MKKKLLFSVLALSIFVLSFVVAQDSLMTRKAIYTFVENYEGNETQLHEDLNWMCNNAEFSSWYASRGYAIYRYYESPGRSSCMISKTYQRYISYYGEYRTYTQVSYLWSLRYSDFDGTREISLKGYLPGGRNRFLSASVPLPQ